MHGLVALTEEIKSQILMFYQRGQGYQHNKPTYKITFNKEHILNTMYTYITYTVEGFGLQIAQPSVSLKIEQLKLISVSD